MTMPTQARSAGPAPGVPAAARALGSRRHGYAEALPRAGPACKPHCGLGDPAVRVAPQAGPALGDDQVEAARRQRHISRARLDEREPGAEPVLAAPG